MESGYHSHQLTMNSCESRQIEEALVGKLDTLDEKAMKAELENMMEQEVRYTFRAYCMLCSLARTSTESPGTPACVHRCRHGCDRTERPCPDCLYMHRCASMMFHCIKSAVNVCDVRKGGMPRISPTRFLRIFWRLYRALLCLPRRRTTTFFLRFLFQRTRTCSLQCLPMFQVPMSCLHVLFFARSRKSFRSLS